MTPMRAGGRWSVWIAILSIGTVAPGRIASASAGPPSAEPAPALTAGEERHLRQRLTEEDHADMMRQLGITRLRPGFNGNTAPGAPNQANYDELKANPYPDWPDVLTLKNGGKVASAEAWWRQRRPEIAEDFEREVLGRIPPDVPGVSWTAQEAVATRVGGLPVTAWRVIGRADNSRCPAIHVDIRMAVDARCTTFWTRFAR